MFQLARDLGSEQAESFGFCLASTGQGAHELGNIWRLQLPTDTRVTTPQLSVVLPASSAAGWQLELKVYPKSVAAVVGGAASTTVRW